ncbi:MAG: hypothetical protein ACLQF1_07260 [Methyloceanibacter sp.]
MTEIDPASAERLVKLLGMLGSDHDGERAAAGALADRLLREQGLSWYDLLRPHLPEDWTPAETFRDKLDLLLDHRDLLTPWERQFVDGVIGFRRVSPKQIAVIDRLVAKVEASE